MSLQSLQRGVAIGREQLRGLRGPDGQSTAHSGWSAPWAPHCSVHAPPRRTPPSCVWLRPSVPSPRPLLTGTGSPGIVRWRASPGPDRPAVHGLYRASGGEQRRCSVARRLWGCRATEIGAVAGALTLSRLPTLMVGSVYGPVLAPFGPLRGGGQSQRVQAVPPRAGRGRARPRGPVHRDVLADRAKAVAVLSRPGLPPFSGDMAVIAAGSGLMFVSVVEQAALVALSAWHRVTAGWLAGLAALAAASSSPSSPRHVCHSRSSSRR